MLLIDRSQARMVSSARELSGHVLPEFGFDVDDIRSPADPSALARFSSWTSESRGCMSMKGSELKQLRIDLGEAIGRSLSTADMAKLCGLSPGEGIATILKWEVRGPSGPAAELLRILAMASDRHPILESFNVFYRFDIEDKERPMRMQEFRKMMQKEVLRRLG